MTLAKARPMPTRCFKIMPGPASCLAKTCFTDGFIGMDYGEDADISAYMTDDYRDFNSWFIPRFIQRTGNESRKTAGRAGGALWFIGHGIKKGDMVVSPDDNGTCSVGVVEGGYEFVAAGPLPHRRPVRWLAHGLERAALGEEVERSMRAPGTIAELPASDALLSLADTEESGLAGDAAFPNVESPMAFMLEKHLESFLVENWSQTAFGKDYDLLTEDGEIIGQQFQTDTGPLDLLAVRKDGSSLLVIELKRGRTGDKVVGQLLRYMSFVQDTCAEPHQTVEGAIVGLEDSLQIRRALQQVPNACFYRYEVDFRLKIATS